MILIPEQSLSTLSELNIYRSREALRLDEIISRMEDELRFIFSALIDAKNDRDYLHHTGVYAFFTKEQAELIYKYFI